MPYGRARATCTSSESALLTGKVERPASLVAMSLLLVPLPRLAPSCHVFVLLLGSVAGFCCWVTTAAKL